MIDAEALAARLREKFVDAEIMTDSDEATAFCNELADVIAEFCQPLEEP